MVTTDRLLETMMNTQTAENINTLTDRRMAYDGEGREVGYLTLHEARERYEDVVYEADTGTISVGDPITDGEAE